MVIQNGSESFNVAASIKMRKFVNCTHPKTSTSTFNVAASIKMRKSYLRPARACVRRAFNVAASIKMRKFGSDEFAASSVFSPSMWPHP